LKKDKLTYKKPTGRPPTHGVESSTVRKRFDDRRTAQGAALHETINSLLAHFGGPDNVSSPMSILIDSAVRPKLIVLMLISEWVNKQSEIVSSDGTIPNVLGANYLAYTNSLRRDLESLTNMAKDAGTKVNLPSITELIK
jgi:hypothetical protein